MGQPVKKILRGYGQTYNTIGRLLFFRHIALRKLAGVPVNLLARLFNRPPPFPPPVLQLDITDMCNLRCPGCLTGMGFNRNHQGMMPFERFQALIDETGKSTALAVLYNSGEPLLHPAAVDMIRYLTGHRIASVISTNGHFVRTREEAEALVAAGLSVMVVSLSGATQKVYEHYHRGGRLDQVIRGVRYMKEARKSLRKKTPIIIFRFLIMAHNTHEKDAMAALAENEGCDWFEFREVNWRACLTTGAADASAVHREISAGRRASGNCLWPWLISVVNWNGDVYPCCFFRLNMPRMGHTGDRGGMKAVWKNTTYNRFRAGMRTGAVLPAACRDCPGETGFQTRFSRQNRTVNISHPGTPEGRADL